MNKQLRQYNEQGYLLRPGFFRRDEIDHLRADAEDVFLRQLRHLKLIPPGPLSQPEIVAGMVRMFELHRPAFINCGKICQHLIRLHRLSLAESLINQVRLFGLDTPSICTRPVLYFNARKLAKSEVYYKTPPHQDWRSMQGSLNALVVWIPLVDVDRQLGAIEIIPGSHRQGLLESEPDEWFRRIPDTRNEDYIPVEVRAGDAVFFSAFLVHRSGENSTEAIRWSCHFRYNDLSDASYVERSYPSPYTYKPDQDLVTPDFPSVAELQRQFPVPSVVRQPRLPATDPDFSLFSKH